MKLIINHILLALIAVGASFLFSCSKDKTPVTESVALTKWEIIPGHYKVYDTLGNFLYEMDLIHSHNDSTNRDSIRFENFDDEFTLYPTV